MAFPGSKIVEMVNIMKGTKKYGARDLGRKRTAPSLFPDPTSNFHYFAVSTILEPRTDYSSAAAAPILTSPHIFSIIFICLFVYVLAFAESLEE